MISIILGSYNRLPRLQTCIQSIQNAGIYLSEPPEIIVIDGGSTDGSLQYLYNLQPTTDIKVIEEGALHGVTRAYNRGFRLASKKFVTWTSDDCEYLPDCLMHVVNRLLNENNKTLVSISMSDGPGKPFINYGENTPVGAGSKDIFKAVDFWSEDFITYASDNDFSIKIHRAGGRVVAELNAKIIHHLDLHDNLHNINVPTNRDSARYVKLYGHRNFNIVKSGRRIYPNIWINANSLIALMNKVEELRSSVSWGNYYTSNNFEAIPLLESMNINVEDFRGQSSYDLVY